MPTEPSSHDETSQSTGRRSLHGWRRLGFPLGAVCLGLLPFVLLECVLAAFDVGGQDRRVDPFVGFSRMQPLFELDEKDDIYRTARSRQLYFGPQQFARHKPEGTFRIFALGGSTVRGRPYETDTSFVKWLEIELNGRDSTRHYETINCGGLSYASYRLKHVLDEVIEYQPDLIVIATGHNEFLEDRTYDSVKNRSPLVHWISEKAHSLRTVGLARELRGRSDVDSEEDRSRTVLDAEVKARLDDASGYASYHRDEAWQQGVIEHFEVSVREMIAACGAADVPLLMVSLGDNLRDCPPFKSEHQSGMSTERLQDWQRLFDEATELEESDVAAALELYGQAEAIDAEYALLAYRMARCFDRSGDMDRAGRYYTQAKDLDICPLRMLEPMHDRVNRIVDETRVPLVDARRMLIEASPDGIPGNNCFMDHVHPNIGSHQRIGQALAEKMEELGLVEASVEWDNARRRETYQSHFDRLGPSYLANGRRRVDWLENWARRNRLDGEMRPRDARGHLHLGQKQLDYGEYNHAWKQFQFALRQKPELAETIFDYALQLFAEGRSDQAEEVLLRLHYEPSAAGLQSQIDLTYLLLDPDADSPIKPAVSE